jgi:hypothetical protein
MSLLRGPRLCASDDGEGYCNYHPLLNTPAGDRDPRRVGHGTMDGAGGPEGRSSHDDLAGADRKLESVALQSY